MRQREGLRDWSGLHKREEKEKEGKRSKGEKPFYGKVCSIDKKGAEIIVFQARGGGQSPFLFMEMSVWGENFA